MPRSGGVRTSGRSGNAALGTSKGAFKAPPFGPVNGSPAPAQAAPMSPFAPAGGGGNNGNAVAMGAPPQGSNGNGSTEIPDNASPFRQGASPFQSTIPAPNQANG